MPRAIPQAWAELPHPHGRADRRRNGSADRARFDIVPKDELRTGDAIATTICERGRCHYARRRRRSSAGRTCPGARAGLEDLWKRGLMETDDAKEGPRAFAEKRKPDYKGR